MHLQKKIDNLFSSPVHDQGNQTTLKSNVLVILSLDKISKWLKYFHGARLIMLETNQEKEAVS